MADVFDEVDDLFRFKTEDERWDLLRERAESYRRKTEEVHELAEELMAMCEKLVPGATRSKVVNQALGIGNVPIDSWIQDRRAELAAGLKPGTLLRSRRKPSTRSL